MNIAMFGVASILQLIGVDEKNVWCCFRGQAFEQYGLDYVESDDTRAFILKVANLLRVPLADQVGRKVLRHGRGLGKIGRLCCIQHEA